MRSDTDKADCQMRIVNLELRILQKTLNEKLYLELNDRLAKQALRYYYQSPRIEQYSIDEGILV